MPVHPRRGEHMRPVHGHSLRLVDRGGVAMIDMGVIFGVERDGSLIIGADGHAPLVHLLDGAKGAVLDLKAAFVFQEHDPVAASAKIGRASCRERVFHYVSYTVVAVSLKNNK